MYVSVYSSDFVLFQIERSGTHQQFVRNNHHHRRNGNSTSRNGGGKRAAVQVTSPVPDSSPYLASDNAPPKTIISVQTSLNGNIFMHCPVDMTEDFQVGVFFFFSILASCKRIPLRIEKAFGKGGGGHSIVCWPTK